MTIDASEPGATPSTSPLSPSQAGALAALTHDLAGTVQTITAAMPKMPPMPTLPAMPKFDFAKCIAMETAAIQTTAEKLQQAAFTSAARGALAMPSPSAEAAERWRQLSGQIATPSAETAQRWRDLIATITPPTMPASFQPAKVQTAAAQTVAQKLQQIASRTSALVAADLQRQADIFRKALAQVAADQERITATAPAIPAPKAAARGRRACPIAARQSHRRDASVRAPRAAHTTPRRCADCRSPGYSGSDADPSHAAARRGTTTVNRWLWEFIRHALALWVLTGGIAPIWMTDYGVAVLFVITTTQRVRAGRRQR